jgi:chromosomal replication initiation ATPase DnaA
VNAQPLALAALEARIAAVEAKVTGITEVERALFAEKPLATIVADAAFIMGLKVREIVSARRHAQLFRARCAVSWVAQQTTGYSLARIGRALGHIDHTSVLHQIRRAEEMREKDPAFRSLTARLLTLAQRRGQ